MSNIPISSLPIANPLTGEETVPLVQAGTTKRTTSGAISALPFGSAGTAASGISFLTVSSASSALPQSRVLTATGPVLLTDGGAGGALTIGLSFTPGTGTVTSVGLSGGTTGLTVSNSPITTSGTMTLGGVLRVPSGGSGTATIAANSVLVGDTLGSSIASIVNGVSGLPLVSTGAGTPPTYSILGLSGGGTGTATPGGARATIGAFGRVVIQTFTATGTYTPTSGMIYADMEGIGGGGAGGGAVGTGGALASGGGGAGGGYSRRAVASASIGSAIAIVIGAGGIPVSGGNGGTGGTTSVGALLTAIGGGGGLFGQTSVQFGNGGSPGAAGTGDFASVGKGGFPGMLATIVTITNVSGRGGDTVYGGGAAPSVQSGPGGQAGISATANTGAGASGAAQVNQIGTTAGGTGGSGRLIITEFCN